MWRGVWGRRKIWPLLIYLQLFFQAVVEGLVEDLLTKVTIRVIIGDAKSGRYGRYISVLLFPRQC